MAAVDIEYSPVSDSEGITDTKRGSFNRLQLCLCIVLAISAVFQFIAIATPGWIIFSEDERTWYGSVFYRTICLKSREGNEARVECVTTSFHDVFRRKYDYADEDWKPALVRTYNTVVQNQVTVLTAWLLTVGTIVFQVFKLTRPNEVFPRLTVINVIVLTCACPLMFQVVYRSFIDVDHQMRLPENSGVMGFPYSLLFYCISFIQTIACLVLIVKQRFDQLRKKDQILAQTNVKFERLKPEYETEETAIKHYRNESHLKPESGSYVGDRRSRGEDGRSHSPRHSPRPRHSSPPREYDQDHSKRPRDCSPSREYDRDRSPRPRDRSSPPDYYRDHSPRQRDRSPPREYSGYHTPRTRNRSPPREHYRNYSPSQDHCSSPQFDSRHRSPPRENCHSNSPQHHFPPREEGGKQSARDSGEYDNLALPVTPQ